MRAADRLAGDGPHPGALEGERGTGPRQLALCRARESTPERVKVCVLEDVSISPLGRAPVVVGAMQQKIMLTLLVAYANRSVTVDRIAEELWGEHPPPRWQASIRTLANSLRRSAADRNLIHWTGRGYRLHRDVDAVDTDVASMTRLADDARVALGEGHFDHAEESARRALALYGGGPWLTDCWYWGDLAAESYCLLGRALLAKESYLTCLLELGRAPEELGAHGGLRACIRSAEEWVRRIGS